MGGDGEVLIARQLTMLLAHRGQFEQLEGAYCRLRHDLSPTAALDRALAELLPAGEHEGVTAFISGEGAERRGGLPPVHHSLIDGLEDLYEQRQDSERHDQRERMGGADLAADLAADAQLAAAYREGRDEAARCLERFPSMVLERVSASPTPTGRRLQVDQARKALLTAEKDYQALGGAEAEAQAAWSVALRDRLPADSGPSGDVPADQSVQVRPGDELGELIGTAPKGPAAATPPPILEVLRSASSSLGDEDAFIALIEAANGHDDHYDPADEHTVEAMETLLGEEAVEGADGPWVHVDGRVRNELWTHMAWGYRVGRYLLTTHGRSPLSSDSKSASCAVSDLIVYVGQTRQRQDVADLMSSPDLHAALHYHPVSSTLPRACRVDKTRAREWVRLAEDLGFLTAFGVDDLTRRPTVDVSDGAFRRPSRTTDIESRRQVGSQA